MFSVLFFILFLFRYGKVDWILHLFKVCEGYLDGLWGNSMCFAGNLLPLGSLLYWWWSQDLWMVPLPYYGLLHRLLEHLGLRCDEDMHREDLCESELLCFNTDQDLSEGYESRWNKERYGCGSSTSSCGNGALKSQIWRMKSQSWRKKNNISLITTYLIIFIFINLFNKCLPCIIS